MNILRNLRGRISPKVFVLLIFGLSIFILFHRLIERFISVIFVDTIFTNVASTGINDVVCIALIITILITSIIKINKYRYSTKFVFLLLIFLSIYSFYRFFRSTWIFTSFYYVESIKYLDILFVVFLACVLFSFKPRSTKVYKGVPFFEDKPIQEIGGDKLGFEKYAKSIADKILVTNTDAAFAIGIDGKWGTGKTSFINLIRKQIDREAIIEIDFNVWNSHTPNAILKDFFDTLQEKVNSFDVSLSRLIINYSRKLVAINDNQVTQTIHASISTVFGSESLSSMFHEINRTLEKIDKKIVIYIDDVDRLDKEEIIEIIRLIRNTANFQNTFFIVAYDRNYVVNALKELNSYKADRFLEKIFQLEIKLPHSEAINLRKELIEKLLQVFPPDQHEIIRQSIVRPQLINNSDMIDKWLESMRDVTRLSNSIMLNSENLKDEILFRDLLMLELLRIKYPFVYEMIHTRTKEFLINSQSGGSTYFYKLKRVGENASSESCLTVYLKEMKELSLSTEEIEKIVELLGSVFTDSQRYSNELNIRLSVVYPSKFLRYFRYGISKNGFSDVEFSKARALSQREFNSKILEWINLKLEVDLRQRFDEIKSFDDKEDFEKIIRAIFYFANIKSQFPEFFGDVILSFDFYNLFNKLTYERDLINLYQSKEELGDFIKTLIVDEIEYKFRFAIFASC
jgi:hypothetical protein